MSVHSINLRGPWNLIQSSQNTTPHSPDPQLPPLGQRIELPFTLPIRPGPARLQRYFHRPTGLEPHDSVQLVIESDVSPAHLWINQFPAEIRPDDQTWTATVTSLLQVRNLLELQFATPANPHEPAGTLFAVRLVIHSGSDPTPRE